VNVGLIVEADEKDSDSGVLQIFHKFLGRLTDIDTGGMGGGYPQLD